MQRTVIYAKRKVKQSNREKSGETESQGPATTPVSTRHPNSSSFLRWGTDGTSHYLVTQDGLDKSRGFRKILERNLFLLAGSFRSETVKGGGIQE